MLCVLPRWQLDQESGSHSWVAGNVQAIAMLGASAGQFGARLSVHVDDVVIEPSTRRSSRAAKARLSRASKQRPDSEQEPQSDVLVLSGRVGVAAQY